MHEISRAYCTKCLARERLTFNIQAMTSQAPRSRQPHVDHRSRAESPGQTPVFPDYFSLPLPAFMPSLERLSSPRE